MTAAICARPEWEQWARDHRASLWDYRVDNETPAAKVKRLRKARELCMKCPLRAKCLERHEELVKANRKFVDRDNRVGGVWGGRIFADGDDTKNDTEIAA